MYRGKRANNRKAYTIMMASLVILCATIIGTMAFILTDTDPLVNTFTMSKVEISVEEEFDGTKKEIVQVKNTGEAAVYVRVALVSQSKDGDGNVLPNPPEIGSFNLGTDWVKGADGYYYYKKSVPAGEKTSDMLDSDLTLENGQTISVLAQCIQATPDDAVTEAWGVSVTNGTLNVPIQP